MDSEIDRYIQELSDSDRKEVLQLLVSSSSSAKNIFLTYCRKKFPEDGMKLKTENVMKIFNRTKQTFESWDESDFGYFDYRLDDNIDLNGNSFTGVVRDIEDSFDDLYHALTEDDIHISDSVKTDITNCYDVTDCQA